MFSPFFGRNITHVEGHSSPYTNQYWGKTFFYQKLKKTMGETDKAKWATDNLQLDLAKSQWLQFATTHPITLFPVCHFLSGSHEGFAVSPLGPVGQLRSGTCLAGPCESSRLSGSPYARTFTAGQTFSGSYSSRLWTVACDVEGKREWANKRMPNVCRGPITSQWALITFLTVAQIWKKFRPNCPIFSPTLQSFFSSSFSKVPNSNSTQGREGAVSK